MQIKELGSFAAKIVNIAGKAKLWTIKNKADILFAAGIATGIATTITACNATLKVNELTEKKENTLQRIDYALENPDKFEQEYPIEVAEADRAICAKQHLVNVAKTVALPATLGFFSFSFLLASHLDMKKTAAAMAASALAAGAKLMKYENWVDKNFGPEKKQEILADAREVVVDKVVTTIDGTEIVEPVAVQTIDVNNNPDVYVFSPETSSVMREMCEYEVGRGEYKMPDDDEVISKVQYLSALLNNRNIAQEYLMKSEFLDAFGFESEVRGLTDGWLCGRYKTPGVSEEVDVGLQKRVITKVSPQTGVEYYEEEWIMIPNVSSNILAYLNMKSENGKI